MKIHARCYPAIILAAYALFVLLGLLLGFRPQHGGAGGHRSMLEWLAWIQSAL